jgi:tetratricopeptide (TPR) repeat protein
MDRNLEDIDSLSVARFAVGGPVDQMPAAEPIEVDGPLSMALGGLVDINSLSTAAFADGGLVAAAANLQRPILKPEEKEFLAERQKEFADYISQAEKYNEALDNYQKQYAAYEKSMKGNPDYAAYTKAVEDYNAKVDNYNKLLESYAVDPQGRRVTMSNYGYGNVYVTNYPGTNRQVNYTEAWDYNPTNLPESSFVEGYPGQSRWVLPSGWEWVPTNPGQTGYQATGYLKKTGVSDPFESFTQRTAPTLEAKAPGSPPAEFTTEAPTAPTGLKYTWDQVQEYQKNAMTRAAKAARNRATALQVITGQGPYAGFGLSLFAEGGEAKSEDAYTEAEIARMREAMQMGQPQRKESESPTRQAVKRIIPRPTAQGPQQPSTLARQQLYALPPYSLDMTGKLGRVGPIRRAEGSPEYGEVAEQMTVGTLPTDQGPQGPSLASQGLDLLKQAGKTVYGNLREAVTDPVAFNKRALGNVAQQLQSDPQEFIMNWTGGGLGGIIKPKGGNVLLENVDKAIADLRPQTGTGLYASEYLDALKKVATPEKLESLPMVRREALQQRIKAAETPAALDNWVQNKLGKYIRTDMGSEADPVRKLADEMSEKVKADYQAGLARIAKMKDDIAKAKAKGKNTDASEAALDDEIEKVEAAFQDTSRLPIQLGPYTHPALRTGEAREKAGFSPFPISKSNLGKQWEEEADSYFIPHRAGDLVEANSPDLAANPWIAKINPNEMVYSVSPYVSGKQMFTHTIDELTNALRPNTDLPPSLRLKPEDMEQLSIEKAFRQVNKINDWRMQQRAQASLEEANRAATTFKEYPDSPRKLKWQELKAPTYTELPPGYEVTTSPSGSSLRGPDGQKLTSFNMDSPTSVRDQALQFLAKNDLERALKYEGSTMRHCVGGYCDDVWTNQTRIFSLRDNKGEPHVTIETAPADIRREGNTPRDFLLQNGDVGVELGVWPKNESRWPEDIDTFLDDRRNNFSVIQHPKFREWLNSKPAEILQIKGKGNDKPNEKYIPFVQDFIRSQQWSRVGDLDYTGLVKINRRMVESLRSKGIKPDVFYLEGRDPVDDYRRDFLDSGVQPYVTKQEFNRLADLLGGVEKYPD